MTKTMTILKADGTTETVTFKGEPNLETIQKAVGGYFEYIRLPAGNGHKKMVANEEGRMLGLPYNAKASELAGQPIVGDVGVY